jgi:hypothetical protein
VIQEAAGHKSILMSARYAHPSPLHTASVVSMQVIERAIVIDLKISAITIQSSNKKFSQDPPRK